MIPRPIYEALPFFYAIVGTLGLLSTDPLYGQLSGALLITAAGIVFSLRRQYRRNAQQFGD